jgi:thymidylate kinase
VMDRSWWSTIAYGYFGSGLRFAMDYPLYEAMCLLPTQGVMPKVVFVFKSPWAGDHHNNSEVLAGYHSLIERFHDMAVVVPKDTVEKVTQFIVAELARRNLLVRVQ